MAAGTAVVVALSTVYASAEMAELYITSRGWCGVPRMRAMDFMVFQAPILVMAVFGCWNLARPAQVAAKVARLSAIVSVAGWLVAFAIMKNC